MKITPTVGRVVWFYPATNQATSGFAPPDEGQPLAAIVARVVDADADVLHLTVFDSNGVPHSMPYVQLVQADQGAPAEGRYATWMPYQIGQAKKKADEPKAAEAACAGQVIGSSSGLYGSLRYEALRAAMGTPGLHGHDEHIAAAKAYEQYLTTD